MRESKQVARLRASPRGRPGVARKVPQLPIKLVAEKPALLGGRKGIVEVSLPYKAVERLVNTWAEKLARIGNKPSVKPTGEASTQHEVLGGSLPLSQELLIERQRRKGGTPCNLFSTRDDLETRTSHTLW